MDKQDFGDKRKVITNLIKLIILGGLVLFFAVEYVIVTGISYSVFVFYCLIMLACLVSFILTVFHKIRKIFYICFIISFCIFCYMHNYNDEIVERHIIDMCLDRGLVYDPIQKICRTDCWKWDNKLGCLKE